MDFRRALREVAEVEPGTLERTVQLDFWQRGRDLAETR